MKRLAKKGIQGYALMTVLLLSAFLMALAGAIGSEVLSGLSNTKTRMSDSTARFAAYAGLQHAVLLLRENPHFNGNLQAVLMPGSSGVSYSLWVCNNSGETDSLTAHDLTVVPPKTIYCSAMGVDNSSGEVALHAMSGVIADRKPVLSYGAFTDTSIDLLGSSQSLSYQPEQEFQPGDGPAVPLGIGTAGDVGTNRYINLEPQARVAGDIYAPADALTGSLGLLANLVGDNKDLKPLANPVDLPKFSSPEGSQDAPSLDSVTTTSGNSAAVLTASQGETTVADSLVVGFEQELVVEPGRYFFPHGLEIDGVLKPSDTAKADDPVIIFVGGDAHFGEAAKVNLKGETAALQLYFVDKGDEEAQTFQMSGQSQFFGTVVGNRVEGVFQGDAELFGGFMGRSVRASDRAKIYFDESLKTTTLAVAANWGLSGITEPKPEVVLASSVLARNYVSAVRDRTVVYQPLLQTAVKQGLSF